MELGQWLRAQWDRVAAVVLSVAGIIALIAGWNGVASEKLPAGQIPYVVSGGLVGIVLIGIGATSWISADLRDEWRKLDRLESVATELLRRTEELEGDALNGEEATNGEAAVEAEPPAARRGNGSTRRVRTATPRRS